MIISPNGRLIGAYTIGFGLSEASDEGLSVSWPTGIEKSAQSTGEAYLASLATRSPMASSRWELWIVLSWIRWLVYSKIKQLAIADELLHFFRDATEKDGYDAPVHPVNFSFCSRSSIACHSARHQALSM